MKTWKPLIIAITILLLTLTACESEPTPAERYQRELEQTKNRHLAFPKDPVAELKISAEDLYRAWYIEPARAKLLYQDKKLQVTGIQDDDAGSFEETRNGYSFKLRSAYGTSSGFFYPVMVNFPKTEAERLVNMRTNGAVTTVRGSSLFYGNFSSSGTTGIVTIVGTCMGYNEREMQVIIEDAYLYIR
jgi:hypothetical protein